MIIGDIFKNKFDRFINKSVNIEFRDSKLLFKELEDFKVTSTVNGLLKKFFKHYSQNGYIDPEQVCYWISGDNCSGKSYVLKVFGAILSNKIYQGKTVFELIRDKIKDQDLLRYITDSVNNFSVDIIPVSFKGINNDSVESIEELFVQGFNTAQGFTKNFPWLAEFERELYKKGQYRIFKTEYKNITGGDWEKNRNIYYFDFDNIIKTLSLISNMTEKASGKYLDKYENNYSINIEKFSTLLNEYCHGKGENHRVVFLLDDFNPDSENRIEIFKKLLYVIKEFSFIKAKIMVAVSSELKADAFVEKDDDNNENSSLKEYLIGQTNISKNAYRQMIDSVLLTKNSAAGHFLNTFFTEESSLFNDFSYYSKDGMEVKAYKDIEQFTLHYPFVPFHFDLLKGINLSKDIALKNSFVLKKPLLNLYQVVGIQFLRKEIGKFIPFHSFCDYILDMLPMDIQSFVKVSENDDSLNDIDLKILKILAVIQYYDKFLLNIENLTSLLFDGINQGKEELMKLVTDSIHKLIAEKLVVLKKDGLYLNILGNVVTEIEESIQKDSVKEDIPEIERKKSDEKSYIKNAVKIISDLFCEVEINSFDEETLRDIQLAVYIYSDELKHFYEKYNIKIYPGKDIIESGIELMVKIVGMNNTIVFIDSINHHESELRDFVPRAKPVLNFFKKQITVFDDAEKIYSSIIRSRNYFEKKYIKNLDRIKYILEMEEPYDYIKELPGLYSGLKKIHSNLLKQKKILIYTEIENVLNIIKAEISKNSVSEKLLEKILVPINELGVEIESVNDLALLDALLDKLNKDGEEVIQNVISLSPKKNMKDIEILNIKELIGNKNSIKSKKDLESLLLTFKENIQNKLTSGNEIKLI